MLTGLARRKKRTATTIKRLLRSVSLPDDMYGDMAKERPRKKLDAINAMNHNAYGNKSFDEEFLYKKYKEYEKYLTYVYEWKDNEELEIKRLWLDSTHQNLLQKLSAWYQLYGLKE